MPTSPFQYISPIMHAIDCLQPFQILELGIGLGKYGALIRDWAWPGFVELDGVEVWEDYRNPNWQHYTMLSNDYAQRGHWQQYKDYDLVLWLDGPEHCVKPVSLELLAHLRKHNGVIIVSVPLGHRPQGIVNSNAHEVHRSDWNEEDFGDTPVLYQDARGIVVMYE